MDKNSVKKELVPLLLRLALLVAIFAAVALNYDKLVNIDVRSIVDAAPNKIGAVAIAVSIFGLKGFTFIIPAMLIYVSVGMAFDTGTALFISLLPCISACVLRGNAVPAVPRTGILPES